MKHEQSLRTVLFDLPSFFFLFLSSCLVKMKGEE